MNLQTIVDEVKTKLTGGILELEITDDEIAKVISASLRELNRYYMSNKLITIPYKSCIDLNNVQIDAENTLKLSVSAILGVFRTDGFTSSSTNSNALSDPLAVSQWQMLSGTGNLSYMRDYAYNYMAWNSLLQLRNTTSTDLAYIYNRSESKIYINISAGTPQRITISYIPQLCSVEDIESDYWIDILVRLAVAQTKIVLGRIRSRYQQSNALWQGDGQAILQEGLNEYQELTEHLKNNSDPGMAID